MCNTMQQCYIIPSVSWRNGSHVNICIDIVFVRHAVSGHCANIRHTTLSVLPAKCENAKPHHLVGLNNVLEITVSMEGEPMLPAKYPNSVIIWQTNHAIWPTPFGFARLLFVS